MTYPHSPGYQNTDTSFEAAQAIEPKVGTIAADVLRCLRERGNAPTYRIAALIGRSYASVQPRTSELREKGLIEDTGDRTQDPNTKRNVIIWRAAPHQIAMF